MWWASCPHSDSEQQGGGECVTKKRKYKRPPQKKAASGSESLVHLFLCKKDLIKICIKVRLAAFVTEQMHKTRQLWGFPQNYWMQKGFINTQIFYIFQVTLTHEATELFGRPKEQDLLWELCQKKAFWKNLNFSSPVSEQLFFCDASSSQYLVFYFTAMQCWQHLSLYVIIPNTCPLATIRVQSFLGN